MTATAPTTCDACLRRAMLVGQLAEPIAGQLERPSARVPGLLALPDDELIAVAGSSAAEPAERFFESFDPVGAREHVERSGVTAVCAHDTGYPSQLLDLDDPPAVLFAAGRLELLAALAHEPSVAIVGSRGPSAYGVEVAHALGRGLGAARVPVISGLALGIDAAAHAGCLAGAGAPVAVLACGAERAYPRRHRELHRRVRTAGVVVSELPPGTRTFRWAFPARNRIMAALARMTVVVEAADPSGSLITAAFAHDLGRAVAAVPGRITWRRAKGTNALLRDGAVPITSTQDVLDEVFGVGIRTVPAPLPAADRRDKLLDAVLRGVEAGASTAELAELAGADASAVRAALGRLEADGLIVRRDLGGWERSAR